MSTKERRVSRYYILSSADEGRSALFIGEEVAGSSDEALKQHFDEPPKEHDTDTWFSAVSENSLRWRQVAAYTRTRISEVKGPAPKPATAEGALAAASLDV